VMLAAAAMNFKRMMNKWKMNPLLFLLHFFQTIYHLIKTKNSQFFNSLNPKFGF
jgi:hypothetical protein